MNSKIFLISSPLHIFQAYLYGGNKSLFIVDESLRGKYSLALILKGRIVYFDFDFSLLSLFIKSFFLKRRGGREFDLYIGNRNNKLVSLILTKYNIKKIIMLDDGLVTYGFQSEKPKFLAYIFKKHFFSFISKFNFLFICYGYSKEMYFSKNFDVKYLSFLGEINNTSDNITVEKIITFSELEAINKDKFELFDFNSGNVFFLSYEQSIDFLDEAHNKDYVFHPRVKASLSSIPYEFLIGNKRIVSGLSSILLVKTFFYENYDFQISFSGTSGKERDFMELIGRKVNLVDVKSLK